MGAQADVPSTMKAAYIKEFKKPLEVDLKRKVPTDLQGHDLLVQIKAAGMCHTDLQVAEGVYEEAGAHTGMVGSHEPAGVVVKVGPDAEKEGKIKVGDRVGSQNTMGFCGECNLCKKQGSQLCENIKGMLGLTLDGGFAEYCVMDSRVVVKVPESIPFTEAAPLFCAGATVYGALKAVGFDKGAVIAIVGIGGLGHLGVQYAKAAGMKVIALDNRQEGLDLLKTVPKHLQPDESYIIHDDDEKNKDLYKKLGEGYHSSNPGVDKVVICAEDRSLIRRTQQFLRKGGVLCEVGLPADGPLEVDSFCLSFKEQTVKGRLICTPPECQDMVTMHAKNGCKTYIEHAYPIEDIQKVFEHYQRKDLKGRIVVSFE